MRPCPHCGGSLSGFADNCPHCGGVVPLAMPWWGWVLGAFLVLLLFLGLSDFQILLEVFGRMFSRLRGD